MQKQFKTVCVSSDACENSIYYFKNVIIHNNHLSPVIECVKVKYTYVGRSWSIIIIIGAVIIGQLSALGCPVSYRWDEEDFKRFVNLYVCSKNTHCQDGFSLPRGFRLFNFFITFELGKYFRFNWTNLVENYKEQIYIESY